MWVNCTDCPFCDYHAGKEKAAQVAPQPMQLDDATDATAGAAAGATAGAAAGAASSAAAPAAAPTAAPAAAATAAGEVGDGDGAAAADAVHSHFVQLHEAPACTAFDTWALLCNIRQLERMVRDLVGLLSQPRSLTVSSAAQAIEQWLRGLCGGCKNNHRRIADMRWLFHLIPLLRIPCDGSASFAQGAGELPPVQQAASSWGTASFEVLRLDPGMTQGPSDCRRLPSLLTFLCGYGQVAAVHAAVRRVRVESPLSRLRGRVLRASPPSHAMTRCCKCHLCVRRGVPTA